MDESIRVRAREDATAHSLAVSSRVPRTLSVSVHLDLDFFS